MLARLLQFVVLTSLALACAWLWLFWSSPSWLAFAGFWAMPVVHGLGLGLEFWLARRVNRSDPSPRASFWQCLWAWQCELTDSLKVFGWWQPFRSRTLPDHWISCAPGQPGVILIHGFVCNRGIWTGWLATLRAQGYACAAINLEPVFAPIEHYATQIETAVTRMATSTGRPPVLVCHSMGGLAARAWLRSAGPGADERVSHIITLGTPHHGTWLGRFGRVASASQMRHKGSWARQLVNDEPLHRATHFTCWYSNCDNIVFPASTAKLDGADNRFAPGLAHVQLALDSAVMRESLEIIAAIQA